MSQGKGDTPRPVAVDRETFAANWARTFRAPVEPPPEPTPATEAPDPA